MYKKHDASLRNVPLPKTYVQKQTGLLQTNINQLKKPI